MKEFDLVPEKALDELDNLELLKYKKELYDYGFELEKYLEDLKSNYLLVMKILKERVDELQYEIAYSQLQREDELGDIDSPDNYIH